MWDSLWHLRGSIRIEGSDPDSQAIGRIESLLTKQRKPTNNRSDSEIHFSKSILENFFPPWLSWFAMVIFDQGSFWVVQDGPRRILRYELRFLELLYFCLFGATMFFVIGLFDSVAAGLRMAAELFLLIYGFNILLALIRVPPKIRFAVNLDI